MGKPNGRQNEDEIGKRLAIVLSQHSLGEVARRTGTPLTSVHRYAHGRRVPAIFIAALVREFQVNPSWLLLGEGSPSLTDVAERTAAVGRDLLELVEAMNAVAHTRLGALSGKHHQVVLRELNSALIRYESLRGKLSSTATEIFNELSKQLEGVMARLDVDRAEELFRAVEQVQRLCFDDSVETRYLELKARWSVLTRDFQAAHRFQARLFRRGMSTAMADDEFCRNALRLAVTLDNLGRRPDALRIVRAAMLLAEPRSEELEEYAFLAAMCGKYMIQEAQLPEGMLLLQRYSGHVVDEPRRLSMHHALMMGLLYSGVLRPLQGFDFGEHQDIKAQDLLLLALFTREEQTLRRAIEYRLDERVPGYKVYAHRAYIHKYAQATLCATSGDHKGAAALLKENRAAAPALARCIYECQVHLIGKKNARAAEAIREACELLKPLGVSPAPVLMLARHHLNVLELAHQGAPEDAIKQAHEFFSRYEAGGFDFFRETRMRATEATLGQFSPN